MGLLMVALLLTYRAEAQATGSSTQQQVFQQEENKYKFLVKNNAKFLELAVQAGFVKAAAEQAGDSTNYQKWSAFEAALNRLCADYGTDNRSYWFYYVVSTNADPQFKATMSALFDGEILACSGPQSSPSCKPAMP